MTREYRQMAVTLARPLSEAQLSSPDVPPNAQVIRDLRVSVSIEKNLGSEPNTCSVTIFNLNEESRAFAQRKPLYVRVDAGYGENLERLFVGELRWGQSVKTPTTWETTLQLGDGDRSFRYGRVSQSFMKGADALSAVRATARAMGLTPKMSPATALKLRRQYAGGLVLEGPAQRELSRTLAPFGLSWSIQDGELQILATEEARLDQALVISEETGMIGSPEFGVPENPKKAPTLHVRTFLKPAIRPGGRIVVESRAISGLFRVQRVVHTADTFGRGWHSEIEARQ
jgi:hypothetical protein